MLSVSHCWDKPFFFLLCSLSHSDKRLVLRAIIFLSALAASFGLKVTRIAALVTTAVSKPMTPLAFAILVVSSFQSEKTRPLALPA